MTCLDANYREDNFGKIKKKIVIFVILIAQDWNRIFWRYPPQIAINCFLVPLDRKFCVEYKEKKFTALNVPESIFILG